MPLRSEEVTAQAHMPLDTKLTIKTESLSPKSDKISPRGSGDKLPLGSPHSASLPGSRFSPKGPSDHSLAASKQELQDVKPDVKLINPIGGISVKTEKDSSKMPNPTSTRQGDGENTRSPKSDAEKSSPKLDMRGSPKAMKDKDLPGKTGLKVDVNRASPKSDRDSPKSDNGRPSSPKVPPLKIIIPTKTTASSDQEAGNLKTLLSKPALPYVINPTQDGGEGGEAQTQSTTMVTASEGQSVPLHSTRASSVEATPELPASADAKPPVAPPQEDKEPALGVSSTQPEITTRKTRGQHRGPSSTDKDKAAETSLVKEADDENTKDSVCSSGSGGASKKDEGKDPDKDGEKEGDKKEEEGKTSERRLTRSVARSQQQQKEQEQKQTKPDTHNNGQAL